MLFQKFLNFSSMYKLCDSISVSLIHTIVSLIVTSLYNVGRIKVYIVLLKHRALVNIYTTAYAFSAYNYIHTYIHTCAYFRTWSRSIQILTPL